MNNKIQLHLPPEVVEILDELLERAKKIDSLNIKNRNDLIIEILNWGIYWVDSEIGRHEVTAEIRGTKT